MKSYILIIFFYYENNLLIILNLNFVLEIINNNSFFHKPNLVFNHS